MKKTLNKKDLIVISSMLFGMFFGAGNLIFPAALGPAAGSNLWPAYIGMFITAVGFPLLAVAAIGISRSGGVVALSSKFDKRYGIFFSTLLYLTIGPLFAIPRCASTSFSVGAVNLLGDINQSVALAVFSLLFFAAAFFFAMRPGKIMTWIGKILNPVFLVFLAILCITALLKPIDRISTLTPSDAYATGGAAFFKGFLEGYNTLDALACLAFGIIVVEVIRKQGVEDADAVAGCTVKAGVFSCLAMGIIYLALTVVAAQSSSICGDCTNGGEVLGAVAKYYFGGVGAVLLLLIVTLACLKTAVGLLTSCAQAFVGMFPKGPGYKLWVIIFTLVSYAVANLGLSTIVAYCVPLLMFIYPLAITLILLALFEKFYPNSRSVYAWTTGFTLFAAIFDFTNTLSSTLQGSGVANTGVLDAITSIGAKILPLFSIGMGWVCPAAIGFVIGFVIYKRKGKKAA